MQASKDIADKVEPGCPGRHVIASFKGLEAGPTLIIVGSIHGNEPAGSLAARRLLPELERRRHLLRGELLFLVGNTRALAHHTRYIDVDLNRHWTIENVRTRLSGGEEAVNLSEDLELSELLEEIVPALNRAQGDVYFVDLHTTSAGGVPFATVGDTLRNRAFAFNFPITIVLGIEEQIDGTLLEYLNNVGAVTMGFESGQHDLPSSVDNHEALIWIALVACGVLDREDVPQFDQYIKVLRRASSGANIIEIRYRHAIRPEEDFKMEPGFKSFQPVRRGQLLARDRNGPIRARETGMVVMPLYQALGDDGFFLGRKVKGFWLGLSSLLRRIHIADYMHLLPGVRRHGQYESTLIVNTRLARLFPLQVFHLLGFRKRRWSKGVLEVSRRRYDLAGPKRFEIRIERE